MDKLAKNGLRNILEQILDKDDITIVDLHTHILSADVREKSPEYQYKKVIKDRGIDYIFETEHNRAPLLFGSEKPINGMVRPGVEISTQQGHVNLLTKNERLVGDFLKKYSEKIHKKHLKYRIHLETMLNYVRDHHNSSDSEAVVFPHSFQNGGILHEPKNRKYPKLWLPSTYKERKYFLEWTNGKRSPDARTAEKVLEIVREPKHNLLLVAGSDSHHSSGVGKAGIVILDKVDGKDITKNMLNENYLVYHVQFFGDSSGKIMTNTPRANNKETYELVYDNKISIGKRK